MSENSPVPLSPMEMDGSRTRRLVPQFSLTRQDLGSDNRSTTSKPHSETPKKPVIRFTREQLIALRKDSKIMGSVAQLTDIISTSPQNPVCFSRLEPEDVLRIYNTGNKEHLGRGRARGRSNRLDDNELERVGDETDSKRDLWDDDIGGSNAEQYDLSELSKAALQFRSDMNDMKLSDEGGIEDGELQEDAMEGLFRDQEETAKFAVEADPVFTLPSETNLGDRLSTLLSSDNSISKLASISEPFAPTINHFPEQSFFPNLGVPMNNNFYGSSVASYPEEWYYTDPQQQIQGPFSQDNMQRWNEEGYFSIDLPIKLTSWTRFHLFHEVFPDTKFAFVTVPIEPLKLKVFEHSVPGSNILAPAENTVASQNIISSVSVPVSSVEKRPEPDLKSTVVTNVASEVPQATLESQKVPHDVSKSDFAKKLLGIGANGATDKVKAEKPTAAESKETRKPESFENVPSSVAAKEISKPSTKSWAKPQEVASVAKASLADIQQQQLMEEERKMKEDRLKEVDIVSSASVQIVPPSSAMSFQLKSLLGVKSGEASKPKQGWSATQHSESLNSSSLKDIMKEEINQKKQKEDSQPTTKVHGSSWAAKAKIGTVETSTSSVLPEVKKLTPVDTGINDMGLKSREVSAPVRIETKKGSDKSDFGGKVMSKEMADWCSAQLKKINGSEDLTLLQFCMSLKSAVEIREYLADYLGSSPQLTNFATEFIKFKEEGKRPQSSSTEKVNDAAIKNSSLSQLARKKKTTK